jgi:ComF family protein
MLTEPDIAAALWPPLAVRPQPTSPGRTRLGAGLRAVLDLVYPPVCLACAQPTGVAGALCAPCWTGLRFITPPVCERTGVPLPFATGAGMLSPEAIAHPPVYRRARAAARYDGAAPTLVHLMKYGDRPDHAALLSAWMHQAGAELLGDADVIVPVPLHRTRLWRRRFNQAALLARALGRRSGVPVDLDGFVRVKPTRSQVGLSRTERAGNIQGAFRVAPAAAERFRGRRVLVVDDVLTTGATANAAARVLLRGGAATVDVLVFARVVTDG